MQKTKHAQSLEVKTGATLQKIEEAAESVAEAIANSITHGFGLLLSITALVILTTIAYIHNDPLKIFSSIVYGSSLVAMYGASTLYHSMPLPKIKYYLRILDHSAIYLLIAGTYTPFALITLHGTLGWTLFAVIWGLALFGIIFKLLFTHRFALLSTVIYLVMGWLVIFVIKPIWYALPTTGLVLLIAGGLAYTGGIVFYAWEKPFSHTIWHVFVLAASACHFFAILFYVII